MKYRPDIDGLRAIAVISVLFHAGIVHFSGGFVGVDRFFVIAGFLITRIIVNDEKNSTFSIVAFYERRLRRIAPALSAVVATTAVFSALLLLPHDLAAYGRSAAAAMLFSSNIVFWEEARYFATAYWAKCFLEPEQNFKDYDSTNCAYTDKTRRNYLLVGDSHAAHLMPSRYVPPMWCPFR
jgi:peptidoglycan/LPS O-acetylase OafA/YrhL